jgi:mRNA-degrading endonuclease RelE of RelBE toxin-antitoxin system
MVSGKIFEKVFRKLDVQTKRRLDLVIRKLEEDPVLGKPLRGDLLDKWALRICC